MHLAIIISSIIVFLSVLVYFLIIRKEGKFHSYFNRTLESMGNRSLPASSRYRMMRNSYGSVGSYGSSTLEDITLGENTDKIINEMLNDISNKVCNRDANFNLPKPRVNKKDMYYYIISMILEIYNSTKFTTEQKKDYIATINILDNHFDITVNNTNKTITFNNSKDVDAMKLIFPDLNLSASVSFDTFRDLMYRIAIIINDAEKYISISKEIQKAATSDSTLVSMDIIDNSPSDIMDKTYFGLLLKQLVFSRKKLSDIELQRINIFLFGNSTPSTTMFSKDSNGNVLLSNFYNALINALPAAKLSSLTIEQRRSILDLVIFFFVLNDLTYTRAGLIALLKQIDTTITSDTDPKITEFISSINSKTIDFDEKFKLPIICSII
jgi:hypothetical protein